MENIDYYDRQDPGCSHTACPPTTNAVYWRTKPSFGSKNLEGREK